MAKKTRTPPPPRRVQAPKVRTGRERGPRRRPSNKLLAVAGTGILGLVAVIVVVVLVAGGGGGSTSVDQQLVAAGCTVRNVQPLHNFNPSHTTVPTLSTPVRWDSFPPAAGMHYGRWAVWGFYTEPVNPRQVVHNEEHGAVVYWWGPKTPQSTVNKLQQLYEEQPVSTFGTPLIPGKFGKITYTEDPTGDTKGLGSKVAITAWSGDVRHYFLDSKGKVDPKFGYLGEGHVAICPSFNTSVEKAFRAFRDKYFAHGPEIPHATALQTNAPGRGP